MRAYYRLYYDIIEIPFDVEETSTVRLECIGAIRIRSLTLPDNTTIEVSDKTYKFELNVPGTIIIYVEGTIEGFSGGMLKMYASNANNYWTHDVAFIEIFDTISPEDVAFQIALTTDLLPVGNGVTITVYYNGGQHIIPVNADADGLPLRLAVSGASQVQYGNNAIIVLADGKLVEVSLVANAYVVPVLIMPFGYN